MKKIISLTLLLAILILSSCLVSFDDVGNDITTQDQDITIQEGINLIFDPKIADRGEYTEFIGYFAVTPWGNYCASVAELSLNTFALNNADVSNIVVDIDTITIGMTYDQVVSILGCSGVDIGYGAILYQYELYNGQKVVLNYCKDTYGEMILCNIIYV
jgi:hypothetical protein